MLTLLFERLRTRRELARLSERMRRDIGVETGEVAGPSMLILQPTLLGQLHDPEPDAPQPEEDRRPRQPLWINMLRGFDVRPI